MKPSLLLVEAAAAVTVSPTLLTFYGYPDNDPPSADIALDCGRGYTASGISIPGPGRTPVIIPTNSCELLTGTGTHANPLTAASAPGEFDPCEVLYIPYLRKYVIIEDTCAKCSMSRPLFSYTLSYTLF